MSASCDAVKTIALIGGGKMGEAIMAGLIRSQEQPARTLDATCFEVANPGAERRSYLEETHGVLCVEDGSLISDTPDVVILAVPFSVALRVQTQQKRSRFSFLSLPALPRKRFALFCPKAHALCAPCRTRRFW